MPTDYVVSAVAAVKHLLIDLLMRDRFCDAKKVGRVLEEILPLYAVEQIQMSPLPSGSGGVIGGCDTQTPPR